MVPRLKWYPLRTNCAEKKKSETVSWHKVWRVIKNINPEN
jgi:hypothetical protein